MKSGCRGPGGHLTAGRQRPKAPAEFKLEMESFLSKKRATIGLVLPWELVCFEVNSCRACLRCVAARSKGTFFFFFC